MRFAKHFHCMWLSPKMLCDVMEDKRSVVISIDAHFLFWGMNTVVGKIQISIYTKITCACNHPFPTSEGLLMCTQIFTVCLPSSGLMFDTQPQNQREKSSFLNLKKKKKIRSPQFLYEEHKSMTANSCDWWNQNSIQH